MASVGSVTGTSWVPQGLATWTMFSLPILSPGGVNAPGIGSSLGAQVGSSLVAGVGISVFATVEADRILKAAAELRIVKAI